jgi:SAM-dependent methyltransferase
VLTVDFDLLGLGPEARVLDLGCGNGRHVLATRWLSRVTGVALDLGTAEVVATVETLRRMDDTEPELGGAVADAGPWLVIRGDSYRLPFPDGCFDCVVASEILEHLQDDHLALDEIDRVLRGDGVLAVSVPRFGPERLCWTLSREYHTNPGGHIRIYRRRELCDKLESHGYQIYASRHAHALHSPYWWLRCLVGVRNDDAPPVRAYHRFLVWEMVHRPRITRMLERALDPMIGKSLVLYARKAG